VQWRREGELTYTFRYGIESDATYQRVAQFWNSSHGP
jgi:hypothetical protein